MFKSTVQRLAITRGPPSQQPARLAIDPLKLPRLTIHNNPFKAKKEWPPDFSKLHPKHQFRFEKRYRRRAKLRYLPPNWVRGVKIAANSSVVLVLVFAIFFMDWGDMPGLDGETPPFEGVRKWCRAQIRSVWSVNSPDLGETAKENDTESRPPS